jgi:hypothetical protein
LNEREKKDTTTILIKTLLMMTLLVTFINVTLEFCFFIYYYKQRDL